MFDASGVASARVVMRVWSLRVAVDEKVLLADPRFFAVVSECSGAKPAGMDSSVCKTSGTLNLKVLRIVLRGLPRFLFVNLDPRLGGGLFHGLCLASIKLRPW